MASLLEARGEDANPDARRGPALWKGRASLGGILAPLIPVLIGMSLFIAGPLAMLLRADIHKARVRWGGPGARWIELDPTTAFWTTLALAAVFFALAFLLLLAVVVPILRPWQSRYRVDGLAVEQQASGVIHRIAIADIHRVAVDWRGAWHMVRIIGRGGQRIRMLLGTREAMRVLGVLRGLGVRCGKFDAVEMPSGAVALAPGEPVRWRGRPGLASLDATRAIATIGLCMPFAILVATLAWIWSAHPSLILGLFCSAFVFNLFGYLALFLLSAFHERFRVWLYDAFGTLVVTDRRIAWRALGSGAVYRDLPLAELVEANIVERIGRRAWVTLLIRAEGGVRDMDLRGVPDADSFVAALNLRAQ